MSRMQVILFSVVLTLGMPILLAAQQPPAAAEVSPIKVGVLHSLTGTMAISERSLVDAITMAVDEINAKGGVLGRPLQAVIEDGASDWPTFARQAEKLIVEDGVASLFGCWTSASRQAVLPVLEKHDHLLWYPVQYEGNERSRNIIYTGATPNQQIIPAVAWCREEFGSKMFLVGSDYVFPRQANEIIKLQLADAGTAPVGEVYRPLGETNFADVIAEVQRVQPDVILNTINGSSNRAFFSALRDAGIGPREIPVLSFSIAEDELRDIGVTLTAGHYCSWSYFQSVDTPANRRFVRAFKTRYGPERVTDDPIEAAYVQVHLFAKAAERAKSIEIDDVRRAVRGLVFTAPEGLVRIDPRNLHTWKVARIGKIRHDGQFKIVWSSKDPLRPRPFLPQAFLAEARLHGHAMFTEISHLIELGIDGVSAEQQFAALRAMADVRGYQGEVRTNFQAAVTSVQATNRKAFEQSWRDFEQRWRVLAQWQDAMGDEQSATFDRLEKAKTAFAANATKMFHALYDEGDFIEVEP